jgi:intraflagellar transport protein 20
MYIAELSAFNNVVSQLSKTLSERSESIDKMKLQAIGQRNIYESERSERKRKRTELTNLIKEKLRELDRQTAQLDSLTQVEREQQALIEKLTSSD